MTNEYQETTDEYAEDAILADILATHESQQEGWKITDDNAADWALTTMETAQRNISAAQDRKIQLINKLDSWFENATQTDFKTVEKMEALLTEYVKEQGKRKLVGGTVYLQKSPSKIMDAGADLETLHKIYPNLVRVKKELDKKAAKALLQSGKESLYAFGIELQEGELTLRIKK